MWQPVQNISLEEMHCGKTTVSSLDKCDDIHCNQSIISLSIRDGSKSNRVMMDVWHNSQTWRAWSHKFSQEGAPMYS